MLITGALLFPIYQGTLPYYENGLHGLLLIIFALQMIALGKTPFGDMPRSKPLFLTGMLIATVGMTTCFIPLFTPLPRILLILCFGPGGLLLLLQMCFSKDKLPKWAAYGGIFRHLILSCAAVYGFSIVIGLLLWKQNLASTRLTALSVLVFGAAILYLAVVLREIYRRYPQAQKNLPGDVALSADRAMLILVGLFMVILGVLLIPVSLGALPFSESAQLGLLMVIFAVQMLAFGNTPIGPFPRRWLVTGLGLLFGGLGVVSCILPHVLVPSLTVLVGVLNLAGGIITLAKMWAERRRQPLPPGFAHPVLTRLFLTQLTLNILAVMFGASMLLPGLVHGGIIGAILIANGGVLLYLIHLLTVVDRIRMDMEGNP